jgi:hypothetical protein
MRKRWIWIAPLAIVGMALFVALGGWIVQLLWNSLLPPLFGSRTVTFWQALGLLVLCRILFGGLGFRGAHGSSTRHRMTERWEQLTPEERERFREGLRSRWGFGPAEGESKSE